MTAWERYRQLFKKHGYKLRVAIHRHNRNGVNVNYRKGSAGLETFILENNDEEAIEIMNKINSRLSASFY